MSIKAKKKEDKKRKKASVSKGIFDIIPIKDRFEDHFLMADGSHMDIYRIYSHDLDSIDTNDRDYMLMLWTRFYQAYGDDIKIISLNYPTDTSKQQDYFEYLIEKNHNPYYAPFLEEKYEKLRQIAKTRVDRFYYMMTFSKDLDRYRENWNIIDRRLTVNALVEQDLPFEEKVRVLSVLGNKSNVSSKSDRFYYKAASQEEQKKSVAKEGFNKYLLADIQPIGNINFNDEKYVDVGTGYEACISIYRFPQRVGLYWMIPVMGIDNTIAVMDINTEDVETTKRNLNDAINENEKRYRDMDELTAKDSALQRIQELREYYQEVERQGQVNKQLSIKVFLWGKTYQEIDQFRGNVIEQLKNYDFQACLNINELKTDWMSIYQSYTEQSKSRQHFRTGQSCLSRALSKGLPFYFTNVDDPYGSYYGLATNNGSCFIDFFHTTSIRTFYNGLVVGLQGSGKSTLIKRMVLDNAIKGNFVRILDPMNEYVTLVAKLGGNTISLDGSDGVLNAFEVLRTADEEQECWSNHATKLKTCYEFLAPNARQDEIREFENQLFPFYQDYGLLDSSLSFEEQTITGLPHEEYPTWSDFLRYISIQLENISTSTDVIQNEISLMQARRLDAIRLNVEAAIRNHGYLIDGKTSINGGLLESPIISFSLQGLDSVKDEIYDLQLFMALQMCWDNLVKIGTPMKRLFDNHEISERDITRYLVVMDEAHKFINTKKLYAVDMVTTFEREARKLFGGIWFVTQRITDFFSDSATDKETEQIKTVFNLCLYKLLLRQDESEKDILLKIFSNILSENDVKNIPNLVKGEMILSLGDRKVKLQTPALTPDEQTMYAGGL